MRAVVGSAFHVGDARRLGHAAHDIYLGTIDIKVIIPAFNEENAVGKVIRDIPKDHVSEVIVVNNASTDQTETAAKALGATVLNESQKCYGNACLKGINYLTNY